MGRTLRRSTAVAIAATAIAFAGACGTGSAAPKAAPDSCPVSEANAKKLLQASAVVRGTPPAITGLSAPRVHCMYASADKSLQVTIFSGNEMMKRFGMLVQSAPTVPELGADAHCTTTTLGSQAGASCLFLHRGDTYILSARVPPAASGPLLGNLTTLAERMAAAK